MTFCIIRSPLIKKLRLYGFYTPEIKNNIELFAQAHKEIDDFLYFLSSVKAKANRANNPKGYLINALKKRLKISTKEKK